MAVEKKVREGKRKRYGQPRSPRGEQALLMAKNKKMRQSQACDRCRLKKIKCDGMKPSCSQCAKVNFTCRTSDRLTRRGFPRGYTEMLETEVVRLQKLMESRGISIEPQDGDSDTKQIVTPSTNEEMSREPLGKEEEEKEFPGSDGTAVAGAHNSGSDGGSGTGAGTGGADSSAGVGSVSVTNSRGGVGELEFPFSNDTFHYYDNYRRGENYMGNSTWDVLTRSLPSPSDEEPRNQAETDCFANYHLSAMKNILHLDSNVSFLPKFLLVKYDYNIPKLVKLLQLAIADFGKCENSLVPVLYPFDKWEKELVRHLVQSNDFSNSAHSEGIKPITLLTLLYIIQLNWSCFNDFKLFQLTKMVCLSSKTRLETLQCILLASFYFMGGQTSAVIHQRSRDNSQVWATELLHIANSIVLNLGLYVNSKRMISVHANCDAAPQQHRVVTFWVFQFLDSWWSFLQGLPKSNFLVDEFHPQSISSLNVAALTPFMLLLQFTVESLDGCNLLHIMASDHAKGRSKLVYVTESFRKMLVKWKLYHQMQDHEDDFDPDDAALLSTTLTKPDMVEIQLTLTYLIVSFLSDEKFGETGKRVTKNDVKTSNSLGFSSSAETTSLHSSNLEEIAYEILSLYSLVLMDHARLEQPQLLKILHLLPCDNRRIIHLCLSTLNNWAISSHGMGTSEGHTNWRYNRYRNMVNQWCKFYLADKLNDSLWQQLIVSFKLDLSAEQPQTFYNWNEVEYLENVEVFNGNPQVFSKSQLIRSNPHAVMDQFDIFSPTNIGGPSGATNKPIFNNIQSNDFSRKMAEEPQQQVENPRSNISEHDSANIIDMSRYRSQVLTSNEETDDGYAEDDDEDDDDLLNKPLEIPLSRRTGSLFHRGPKNRNDNGSNYGTANNDNSQGLSNMHHRNERLRRHTLDHIILDGPQSETMRLEEPAYSRQGEPASLDGADTTSNGKIPFQNYALDAKNNKRNRSQSISVPPHAGQVQGPPQPPQETQQQLPLSNKTIMPSAAEHGDVLFNGLVEDDSHDSHSSHSHFVETPRALVDMLMLPSEGQQGGSVVNGPSSCNSLAARSSDTNP